ncbi:BrnT family toxin [Rubritalea tangerina]|uniref:BrnT family toxin n=1 Tax=Rubritalea tangerina TaxID=430798 RepID=A0ABW4Z631_9BACT
MELDLIDAQIDLSKFSPREIEEVLEDPFTIRFLPDHDRQDGESRYYMIGRTVGDRFLFLSFSTDGKKARIYAVREMTDAEKRFYDRRYAEFK